MSKVPDGLLIKLDVDTHFYLNILVDWIDIGTGRAYETGYFLLVPLALTLVIPCTLILWDRKNSFENAL